MSKGEKLRLLREKNMLSQVEAAEKIGVSKQTLYKYEKDIITNIPYDVIERIVTVYGTTPAYIFGWEDQDGKIVSETEIVPKNNFTFDEKEQAFRLYDLYEQASPEVRSAVELLLKSVKQDS